MFPCRSCLETLIQICHLFSEEIDTILIDYEACQALTDNCFKPDNSLSELISPVTEPTISKYPFNELTISTDESFKKWGPPLVNKTDNWPSYTETRPQTEVRIMTHLGNYRQQWHGMNSSDTWVLSQ